MTGTDCRWYVTRDGQLADWSRVVADGVATEDVMAVTMPARSVVPWAALWIPAGMPCGPEQVEYALATQCTDPLPPLRRRTPPPVTGPGHTRAQLRVLQGGRV